jgi:hypothetical protein
MINCLGCGKEIKERGVGTCMERKFCTQKCASRFRSKRDYYNGSKKKLAITNPELYKKLLREHYYKNKPTWQSRMITNQIFREFRNIDIILPKECYLCKDKNNLQIHHEIYPTNTIDIIDALIEKRIYYLCLCCHGKTREINNKIKK